MAPFAWQRSKAILFSDTQNSVSAFGLNTGKQRLSFRSTSCQQMVLKFNIYQLSEFLSIKCHPIKGTEYMVLQRGPRTRHPGVDRSGPRTRHPEEDRVHGIPKWTTYTAGLNQQVKVLVFTASWRCLFSTKFALYLDSPKPTPSFISRHLKCFCRPCSSRWEQQVPKLPHVPFALNHTRILNSDSL